MSDIPICCGLDHSLSKSGRRALFELVTMFQPLILPKFASLYNEKALKFINSHRSVRMTRSLCIWQWHFYVNIMVKSHVYFKVTMAEVHASCGVFSSDFCMFLAAYDEPPPSEVLQSEATGLLLSHSRVFRWWLFVTKVQMCAIRPGLWACLSAHFSLLSFPGETPLCERKEMGVKGTEFPLGLLL